MSFKIKIQDTVIGIMGYGEVGSSLGNIYKENNYKLNVYDPYKNIYDDFSKVNVLNVCIPCKTKEKFLSDVFEVLEKTQCKLLIIHSSILIGIISDIKKVHPELNIVHSPIRGVHPNLTDGIKTFVKYVGHVDGDLESGMAAKEHLEAIGLNVTVTTSKQTILMKLLSTTYYGMCIAFTEDMGKLCDKENIDMEMIHDWTKTYNKGYTELNMENVCRPVLSRIPGGKKIGGHCVIPNANLLKSMYPKIKAWDYVLQYE